MLHSEQEETAGQPSAEDTLEYISDMLLSLEDLARRSELESLADLIEKAHEEAHRQASKSS